MNYYMSILVPTSAWIDEIGNLIEKFVLQGMNVAKDKLYSSPEEGGLGLFALDTFFKALKCSWVKRSMTLTHDNWRRKIMLLNPGVCFIQRNDTRHFGPLIAGILNAVIDLREAFGTQYNNFHNIPVLNNKFFSFRERGAARCFDTEFFDARIPGLERDALYKLSWADMTADGILLSINQLSARLNSNISTASYKLLENSYKNARKKFWRPEKPSLNFLEFMLSKNKSSRPARKILSAARSLVSARKSNCPLNNFALIADIPRPSSEIAKQVNSLWTVHFLSSDVKTFFLRPIIIFWD
jgi:hypothetical protein